MRQRERERERERERRERERESEAVLRVREINTTKRGKEIETSTLVNSLLDASPDIKLDNYSYRSMSNLDI